VELGCVELNEKEKQLPPLRTFKPLFTNTGTELCSMARAAALQVRVLGPYEGSVGQEMPRRNRDRILVNADYLGLGLDRGCESVLSVNAAKLIRPTLSPFA